jgi:hypothetical protein
VEAKMFDLNQTLNKIKLAEMLANVKAARRMRPSGAAKQAAPRSTAPHKASAEAAQTSTQQGAQRPHLTDTEALTRKVREDMVRDARSSATTVFKAIM